MKHTQFFLGIDMSKPFFDATLMPVVQHKKQEPICAKFDNSPDGLKKFHKWLKANKVIFANTLLVIENTGIYHRLLWAFCNKYHLSIHIGNAAHIKWSFGIARGKNDTIDSVRLCNYAYKEADTLKAHPVLNPILLQLKDLMTARTKLLSQINSLKVYLKKLKNINDMDMQETIEMAHCQAIEGMEASLNNLEVAISKIVLTHEDLKQNYDLLLTVPGVGRLTAIYLICCTGNFIAKISGKQLACYAGVVPFEHSSGISIKGRNRVHPMANKDLKKMLHMCAISTIKSYPEFQQYYKRKKEEGKHSMSVLNAIRNKIVLRVVAVINNQKPYVQNISKAA